MTVTGMPISVPAAADAAIDDAVRRIVQGMLCHVEAKPGASDTLSSNGARIGDAAHSSLPADSSDSSRTYSSDGTLFDSDSDDDFCRAYWRYSCASHMGVLDPGYRVFTSQRGLGSLLYTVRNRTLVVSGDPLCSPHHFGPLLEELRRFRRAEGLRIAFMGVSGAFVAYAREQGWLSLQFGRERVVNPTTSKVLHDKGAGRRMASQNRQLLDPERGGITLGVYAPGVQAAEPQREAELQAIYDAWREARNRSKGSGLQTFVTVYDLFSRRNMALFVYTCDGQGRANGFAALRGLGASGGFHLDPCIAAAGAPRGITDLLVVTAMRLLAAAGVPYLSLGYEPLLDLDGVPEQEGVVARLARATYRRVVDSAQLGGKKSYNDKFRPDEELSSSLYVVLPGGASVLQQAVAVMHVANIKMRRLLLAGSVPPRPLGRSSSRGALSGTAKGSATTCTDGSSRRPGAAR